MSTQLETQIKRFRQMKIHQKGCNSLAPQPKQEGFHYDYYVVMHCDCFLSLKNPTEAEKVKFVRQMADHYSGVHATTCNTSNPSLEKYRDQTVYVTRNCNCWLSQVDKPAEPAYTEPMTNPDQPDLSVIKEKVENARSNALGPHLDTPIYDALAREYDLTNNTYAFFESALAQKLNLMGKRIEGTRNL